MKITQRISYWFRRRMYLLSMWLLKRSFKHSNGEDIVDIIGHPDGLINNVIGSAVSGCNILLTEHSTGAIHEALHVMTLKQVRHPDGVSGDVQYGRIEPVIMPDVPSVMRYPPAERVAVMSYLGMQFVRMVETTEDDGDLAKHVRQAVYNLTGNVITPDEQLPLH